MKKQHNPISLGAGAGMEGDDDLAMQAEELEALQSIYGEVGTTQERRRKEKEQKKKMMREAVSRQKKK